MAPAPVLLSRTLDPILGIFTGVFAYYLYETNPRTAPTSPDLRLNELSKWKLDKMRRLREEKMAAEDDSRVIVAEILKSVDGGK